MASSPPKCSCSRRKTGEEYAFRPVLLPAGVEGTLEFRVFFANQHATKISPWHSIPLFADRGMLHMVCEIPRKTRAKFEVSTSESGNPIKQDVKNCKLRFYGIDMEWNYGMFPQTWEDPAHASADCGGYVGDNDPVDVVDIGNHDANTGAVYAVKPVAAIAMIDEGELDWKVVAISEKDPRSRLVHNLEDIQKYFPGQLDAIREWFRTYKTHEGKPLNKFELNEAFVGQEYTMDVIMQTHEFWRSLVTKSKLGATPKEVSVGDVPVITSCLDDVAAGQSATSPSASEAMKTVMEVIEEFSEGVSKGKERIELILPDREATKVGA